MYQPVHRKGIVFEDKEYEVHGVIFTVGFNFHNAEDNMDKKNNKGFFSSEYGGRIIAFYNIIDGMKSVITM